jgi:NarL family two-component system response regulator LiaR
MIVDDHAMVRSGIRAFLKSYEDLQLVGAAGGGREATELCRSETPDVVLMDIMMPGMDGIETTRRLLEISPQSKVVALANTLDPEIMTQVLQAGAVGFLNKSVSADELASAIRDAHAGRTPLSPEAAAAMIQLVRRRPGPGDNLTERELEVLGLMVEGSSNAQIAERLVVSLATAKFHVAGILGKLGAANRAEAVTIAWQKQLVKRE